MVRPLAGKVALVTGSARDRPRHGAAPGPGRRDRHLRRPGIGQRRPGRPVRPDRRRRPAA
ncbi:hypothetical protein LP420_40085 [Massilia sp. B-10]|nr:hypothetical protein LP420_40085 [Massilia sp. B-10]